MLSCRRDNAPTRPSYSSTLPWYRLYRCVWLCTSCGTDYRPAAILASDVSVRGEVELAPKCMRTAVYYSSDHRFGPHVHSRKGGHNNVSCRVKINIISTNLVAFGGNMQFGFRPTMLIKSACKELRWQVLVRLPIFQGIHFTM